MSFFPRKEVGKPTKLPDRPKLVNYTIEKYVKKIGDGENDFIVKEKLIFDETDLVDYMNTQAKEVGVDALMRRITATGDMSLLPPKPQEAFVDLTKVSDDYADNVEAINKGHAIYNSLSEEIKQGMSFESFMTSFDISKFLTKPAESSDKPKEGDE